MVPCCVVLGCAVLCSVAARQTAQHCYSCGYSLAIWIQQHARMEEGGREGGGYSEQGAAARGAHTQHTEGCKRTTVRHGQAFFSCLAYPAPGGGGGCLFQNGGCPLLMGPTKGGLVALRGRAIFLAPKAPEIFPLIFSFVLVSR